MTFFRSLLVLCPAAVLLAQNPSPKPPAGAKPAANQPNATPAAPSTPASNPFVTPGNPAPATPAVPPDKVVIAVGDTKITYSQYEALIAGLPEQYRNAARGPGRAQFANQLVKVLVLAEEGKRRKLDQNPGYRAQVDFQSANVLAGFTLEDINNTKPDEAQMQKFYETHKSEFETVHARHILIRMQGSSVPLQAGQKDLTDEEALAKAQEIRKKIIAGGDFADLAKTESDDTSSKANGGDLGSFARGRMVAPFDQAAFTLKVGEVSEPVKTPFGYHIIKVEERNARTLDEARQEVNARVKVEYLEQLQSKSNVVIDPELFGTAKQ